MMDMAKFRGAYEPRFLNDDVQTIRAAHRALRGFRRGLDTRRIARALRIHESEAFVLVASAREAERLMRQVTIGVEIMVEGCRAA